MVALANLVNLVVQQIHNESK